MDCMTRSNNFKPFEVSWKAINDHDFAHIPFFEALISPTFVLLYFDFDEIATDEELYDVLEWLDNVAKVFGKHNYGGYSNDESIAKEIGFRYIANDKHYVSMHVIYYETRISASDLQMIMSHTAKGGYNIGDNFLVESSLIMLNEEELYGLVSEFEPEYDNLITILPILYHSSYELQTLSAVLTRWYNQREHTNGCPVDNFANYYEQELSNKWFFSLL